MTEFITAILVVLSGIAVVALVCMAIGAVLFGVFVHLMSFFEPEDNES